MLYSIQNVIQSRPRHTARRVFVIVGALVLVALAGCGPSGAPTSTPESITSATAAPTGESLPTLAATQSAPTASASASVAQAAPTAAATASATTSVAQSAPTASAPATVEQATLPPPTAVAAQLPGRQPIAGGPILLRDDITLRKVMDVGAANIKLVRDPKDGNLYYLNPNDGIFRVDLTQGTSTRVAAISDVFTDGLPAGMTFAPDGTLLVLANRNADPKNTQAVIRKGVPDASGNYTWSTFASTEPYPLSNTYFDHLYNGLVVSPDGKWVFVNAGSRSDHGEIEDNGGAFPNLREVPLTSAIMRLPADANNLVLPADDTALKPYLYADGTRNSYDPEFAPNGELFAGDNGPDADFPDELNWIQQGHHYGFPWRFGNLANPQTSSDYNPATDKHLQHGFSAVDNGKYQNDPTFPQPPAGVAFTDPIANAGPDGDKYRNNDGSETDSSDAGKLQYTFTPHISPLGLVFATDPKMPADLRGDDASLSAFILSYGAAAGTLSDMGQYLLHMKLTKTGDSYQATTTTIARGFKNPIDAVLIENKLYVLEWGQDGAIWELTFQ